MHESMSKILIVFICRFFVPPLGKDASSCWAIVAIGMIKHIPGQESDKKFNIMFHLHHIIYR